VSYTKTSLFATSKIKHPSDLCVNNVSGGEEVILEFAGKDATEAFEEVGHSKNAQAQLAELQIGVLDSDVCASCSSSFSWSYT
jgi:cytochrome b involved in lipid metabolism